MPHCCLSQLSPAFPPLCWFPATHKLSVALQVMFEQGVQSRAHAARAEALDAERDIARYGDATEAAELDKTGLCRAQPSSEQGTARHGRAGQGS